MSCDRRCFDKESKWYGHEDCNTCPGADVWRPRNKPGQVQKQEDPDPWMGSDLADEGDK